MTDPDPTRGDRTDAELVALWKSGDQRAATELVQRHATALARFAVSRGARDDIEELVQDTFVRAFSAIDSWRAESSLRTWLFSIERHLLLDRRRSESRRPNTAEANEADAVTEYNALDRLVASETQTRVRDAVERLTVTQREVFILRVQAGLSYKEIAEAVGTTEGAARVHYHNAVRAIRESIDV